MQAEHSGKRYGPNHHKHPYHLVDPSPWPAVGAVAALCMTAGGVIYMHYQQWWLLVIGLALALATMFLWWRDVVREATFEGHHTQAVQIGLRYGMALFIASEVMFFVAWFWAFFGAALFPADAIDNTWPPAGIAPFDPWQLPFLNTLILLMSGVTVTWAHHALREGHREQTLQGLALTIILGATFTCVQLYEYTHAAFGFRDGIYASTFFMATGFHGFHVLIGTLFLIVCFYRTYKGHFTPTHHFGFEAAAWYWHFVDVVWLFLFTCIYWWGKGRLYNGLLTVAAKCESCGLDLSAHDSGDGPAVFVVFILGFVVVGAAFVVEMTFEPPLWVHAVIWIPVIIGLAILLLRPAKAIMVALHYKHLRHEYHGG